MIKLNENFSPGGGHENDPDNVEEELMTLEEMGELLRAPMDDIDTAIVGITQTDPKYIIEDLKKDPQIEDIFNRLADYEEIFETIGLEEESASISGQMFEMFCKKFRVEREGAISMVEKMKAILNALEDEWEE